jgi:steroid delta-isomerase-like uncharacterized protein
VTDSEVLVRRFVDEVWSRGNLDVVDSLVADNYVNHDTSVPLGREGVRVGASALHAAFPESRLTIQDVIASGDRVVVRWRREGVHRGELFGIPATGRTVAITGIDIYRTAGGQIAEHWHEVDLLGLLRQLGALPGS